MLYAENYDILLVSETWLNAGISSGLLDPESYYYVLRNDRSKSDTGGGVCAFVSRKLRIVEVDVDARFSSLELLGFDLLCSDSKIRFFVVYRPPYRDLQYLQLLIECLTVYTDCIQTNVITGDFNFPSIDWVALNSPDDCINRPFLDFAIERGFCQCVDFATRGGHVLDIVLTDDD
jgi:Endonuclease-reverse transcriptase